TGAPVLAVLALLVRLGLRGSGRGRAVALGLAAGVGDAAMAVLTKAFARGTEHGWMSLLGSWVPYALCASGIVAVLLTQSAYQTGRPKIALPLITVTDPLVSCGVGVGLFGEAVHLGGGRGPIVALAAAVMAAGLVWLSHSSARRASRAAAG
ncbi:MAG: DMT family transporter, partial [Acidimicrobiales bacterium]